MLFIVTYYKFYSSPFLVNVLNFIGLGLLFIKNAFKIFYWPAYTVLKSNTMSGYYELDLFGFTMNLAFYKDVATTYMKFFANIYWDFISIIPLK